MPLNIETFRRVADSAIVTSRDIAIQGEGDNAGAKLGNYIFSQGSKVNDATMAAFKAALEKEYGVFGTHAFDTYVGTRSQLHQSLRASDVKKVLSNLTTVKAARVTGEIVRQLDTSPKMLQLSPEMQKLVRADINASRFSGINLVAIKSADEIAKIASDRIDRAISDVKAQNVAKDASTHEIGGAVGAGGAAKPNEAVGLKNLKVSFQSSDTSIEDQIKSGIVGVGMSVWGSMPRYNFDAWLRKNNLPHKYRLQEPRQAPRRREPRRQEPQPASQQQVPRSCRCRRRRSAPGSCTMREELPETFSCLSSFFYAVRRRSCRQTQRREVSRLP